MKRKILFIIAATMLLFGCKKYIDYSAIKFEITNEEWTISGTTATLRADYSWPWKVVSIAMDVSEDGGFANAKSFEATVSGNSLTVTATGLKAETKYYYRMRLNMEDGKVEGETKTFKTTEYILPTVTTSDVNNITSTTAKCGGEVTEGDFTVTARGVCWNTTDNPTIDDSHTVDGGGAGAFTSNITGLTEITTYYVRAYATSSAGTTYGDTRTFKTNNLYEFTVNGVSFEMVYVEGGTFDMGATSEQGSDAGSDEYPVHSVTLSDYYIGKYEVTQEQWLAVMGSWPGPAPFNSYGMGANYPAYYISWDDCQNFIKKLNSLTGRTFRLPTEAEWEYAARGGNKSRHYKYSGSGNIDDVAWYDDNSGKKSHAVGTKTANELGIYDMSGNVWEWCSDWYGGYSAEAQTNPQGPSSGSLRVLRGGSWNNSAWYCRVSDRNFSGPDFSNSGNGLRLVLVP